MTSRFRSPAQATDEQANGEDVETVDVPPRRLPIPLLVLGIVLYAVLGGLSAAIAILLVPFRVGASLVPIAVVLAIAGNIVLPRLARDLNGSIAAALAPVLAWIVVLAALSSTRPEGDVLLPGGGSVQFVSYGVMLGGLFTGLVSIAVMASTKHPRRLRTDYGAEPGA
ncbi:MAG: hypothetical protein QOK10_2663 [Pseudonocardiales bacterium]|jgi:hypothetical protein|nr:hypothetical protein [Pseudonocardiales bacterium]